jgi:four helix bundle protein
MSEEGFKKLIVWQNARVIRKKTYELTKEFPKNEYRRVAQMRDSARSVKQNIQEGYRLTTANYIRHLDISRGSLNELMGDVDDCYEDNLIGKDEFEDLYNLCRKTDYLFMRQIGGLRKRKASQKG